MLAGQITRLPQPGRDRLDLFLIGRLRHQDHERRQVLIERAESVGGPGAQAGPAGDLVAGLHGGDGRLVVDRLGVHRANEAHLIDHLGRVRQQFAHPHATLAMSGKLELGRSNRKACLAAGHGREALPHAHRIGQVLVEPLGHLGLVIVQVHLRRAADHVQVDDVLGLAREMRSGLRLKLLGPGAFLGQQAGQRTPADGVHGLAEEVPAGQQLQRFTNGVHGDSPSLPAACGLASLSGLLSRKRLAEQTLTCTALRRGSSVG